MLTQSWILFDLCDGLLSSYYASVIHIAIGISYLKLEEVSISHMHLVEHLP